MKNQFQTRDTINEFPDELLLKILSFLSTKDVIATSALSKRWRSLWQEVKTYMYDGGSQRRCYYFFAIFIGQRSNGENLQVKMNPSLTNRGMKPFVNNAVARSLREMRIEMCYDIFELPQALYIFSRIETLILEKLSLVDVPPDVRLPCLKRLHLLSVRFACEESVKSLLGICPRLEDLVVRRSSYTNVRIFTIFVPTLKSLSIDNTSGTSRPTGVHGFVIDAPSLRCFSIRDSFSNYLHFENMPELVRASVNVVCDQPDKFLGSLASTQFLSLCSVISETPYPLTGTSFLVLDHLELCLCSEEWWNLLTRILNASPRLRVLKLKLYRKHCVLYNDVTMDPPDSVPECLSFNLEILEWRQYNGTELEREAAKYILANASHLKKATFYSESTVKHGMFNDSESVARSSKTCQLVFD